MFTGLIEATGTIEAVTPAASGRRMRVHQPSAPTFAPATAFP
jgi:riboflavin synthase alpha subunit